MNKTIWKFPLENTGDQSIQVPKGAEILTIQTQNQKPCLWVLVDPDEPKEGKHIEIFGTGHPIRYDMGVSRKYLGTYQLENGSLVLHVFEYTGT